MSPPTRPLLTPGRAAALSLTLVAAVFAVDLCLPLGVASAVPYTFAVLLALRARPWWFVLAVAGLCGVLTVLKMGLVPERGTTEMWKVVVNRCLALFSIGMTTLLGVLGRRAEAGRREAEGKMRDHLATLAHLGRLHTAGQLATGLAHELNQPLAAIGLQAEIAEQFAAGGDTNHDALMISLAEITEQSQRAAAIVKTLRRLTQPGEEKPGPVDLNDVIRSVAPLIDREARRAGADVQLHLTDPLPPVWGDRVQLEQVVFNLLRNAVEAVAGVARERVARVESAAEGDAVTVVVRDTGCGLPPGDPERVFERFYTTKPGGMGVGLAISRSIVESHGGRLWADREPTGGAAFRCRLPAERGA